MEKLFKEQEALYEKSERIENDLFKLIGFNFPTPQILYYRAVDKEISLIDFVKAFNLMFEYRRVRREIYVINAELEETIKELKK